MSSAASGGEGERARFASSGNLCCNRLLDLLLICATRVGNCAVNNSSKRSVALDSRASATSCVGTRTSGLPLGSIISAVPSKLGMRWCSAERLALRRCLELPAGVASPQAEPCALFQRGLAHAAGVHVVTTETARRPRQPDFLALLLQQRQAMKSQSKQLHPHCAPRSRPSTRHHVQHGDGAWKLARRTCPPRQQDHSAAAGAATLSAHSKYPNAVNGHGVWRLPPATHEVP